MARPEDYEWKGKYQECTVTDYWCSVEREWSYCPGPCDLGGTHHPVQRRLMAKLMELKDG